MSADDLSTGSKKDAQQKGDRLGAFYRSFEVAILSLLLLAVAIGQRLGFKIAGYGLGRTPFLMILLSVSGSVPLNTVLYVYMLKRTGGVLPEYRTLRYFRDYWVIATLNIGNGLAIMWANPYVSGYVQALMSNSAIPITMVLSVICFSTKFSVGALGGVFLILSGLFAVTGSPDSHESSSSMFWTLVFIAAQFPLSAACVYQEHAFRESLNMVHYIHYVTLFLLVDLVLAVPLDITYGDARSFQGFRENIVNAAQCVMNTGPPDCEGVGLALFCYIFCMNAGNLFQALLIKRVDATWYMVVLSVSTPLAAISFACPWLVGEIHAESLDLGAVVATVLVGIGTIIYRLGSLPQEVDDATQDGYQLLGEEPCSSPRPFIDVGVQTDITVGPQKHDAKKLLSAFLHSENNARSKTAGVVAAGIGLFASEYTNATKNPLSIFDERTFRELELDRTSEHHGSRSRSSSPFKIRDISRQVSA